MTESIANERFPYFSEEHEMLRRTIRRFLADKVLPVADAWEEQGFVPREILREMGSLGLLGMRYAPEYGGSGLDTLANAVLGEELGRSTYGGFAVTVLVHTDMASPHLFHGGSADQLKRWMPDITAGRKITAVAMTEPDAGSDLASMRTTARKVAGGYVLNGSKMFITNGVHGDLIFDGRQGRRCRPQPHAQHVRDREGHAGLQGGARAQEAGWLSSDTAELVFEDCFVPEENLLGEEGRGFYALVKNLQNERIVLSAQALGEAMKAIELTLDWVKQRRAFGATLWDKQVIRQRLSMRLTQVEAARAFLFNTAWRDTQQENVTKEVAMLKALAGTLVNEVLYDCVQFHGGMGYMRESAVERMARDARVQSIGGGATEVMLDEVAKRI